MRKQEGGRGRVVSCRTHRSLTEEQGLKNSHLTYMSTPSGAMLLILTMGVSPTVGTRACELGEEVLKKKNI